MDDFPKAMNLVQEKIMKVGSRKASEGYCLWAETWKKLDAADIEYLWCCNPDAAIMKALNPKIKFTQGETLMTGNSFCDNQITWEED